MSDLLSAGDVMKIIVEPMQERWNPPRGETLENTTILGDYVAHLKEFDAEVLKEAFSQAVLNHEYRSWPSVKFFRDICVRVRSEKGGGDSNDPSVLASKRTTEAHEYAKTELNKFGKRPWAEGWARAARKFLVHHACVQLREGHAPNVPITEEDIAKWKADFEGRQACWATRGNRKPARNSLGAAAQKIAQKTKVDLEPEPETISMEDLDKMAEGAPV
jgi:hypothetical protein